MINNPVAYYKEVGFTSPDSLVYTASLIGAVGGIGGIIQGVRFKDTAQILTFSLMLIGCGAGAWQGLKIANMNY
jgi:hypothetical protein|tara:strand:+ start:485 stop:706 length:222 start_codon:yes stop_codon:yes gene_type:complete